jgi:hypothetical protein
MSIMIGYKIEKEVEIKGTGKVPPVSYPEYLPVWDNETERYDYRLQRKRNRRGAKAHCLSK